MEQTRTEPVIRTGPGADRAIPAQQDRDGRRQGGPRAGEPARGEHVHSEPAAPRAPQRHSVRGQVLSALRESLLCGELRAGEVYSAPALAERFGVSPTPVREAMQQLASEGAVETVPNRGFRVAEHSVRDAAELSEVQLLLEVPSVLGLVGTLPAERWRALRPLAEATVGPAARGDRPGYAEADTAFHTALLELTGNRRLVAVAGDVRRRVRRPTVRPAELAARAAEHVALVEALAVGDAVRAERVLRGHLAP
ncbi:GntR family transcriptional regulator [Streptomyces sp. 549]|uniref:GntR family transcriptional regulator n=1 Tax=Streptomyces sp. 549 TaxID=3049076 RepID=UPI0024C23A14|nr:GntR family transcriptional regulator [Streptomyces sp. 549]MDK1475259.1 GntR family transcriptional regulator [Streptomyces sp. 549]